MTRLITLIIMVCALQHLLAQTFTEQKTIYPSTINEGKRIISGFQAFEMNDDDIFSNAMKWTIENNCQHGRDALFDIQVNNKNFSFSFMSDVMEAGKPKYSFTANANIRVVDGKLVYTIYDIQYNSNSFVPINNIISLDRLSPDKKPKHKVIINSFEQEASKILNQLFDAIIEKNCKTITHWNDINIQRAVKGMNEDECTLAFGKPNSKYEGNGKVQWSYGLNFVIIFCEGIVETILR